MPADPRALAVRLGLRYVKGLRERAGRAIAAARAAGPFRSVADLARRAGLARDEVAALAAVGALAALGGTRRGYLWAAAAPPPAGLFAGEAESSAPEPPVHPLREMTDAERLAADYHGTGLTLGPHPLARRRAELAGQGLVRAADLAALPAGRVVRLVGNVIVRQRPGTAKGFVFLSLEDETGIANAIVTPQLFARCRLVLVSEPFLVVEGVLQQQDGVTSIRARHIAAFHGGIPGAPSHDFG